MSLKVAVSICAISCILLSGCSHEPPKCSDAETVNFVTDLMMQQMRVDLSGITEKEIKEHAYIELARASAYDETVKKYTCDAKFIAGNLQLPISYESQLDDDNKHIVSLSGVSISDLSRLAWSFMSEIKRDRDASNMLSNINPDEFVGKSPYDVVKSSALTQGFSKLLGGRFDDLTTRVLVASGVEKQGEWLVGEGGRPHMFTIEEAAFAVNVKTGKMYVVLLSNGESIEWFGAEKMSDMPDYLQKWFVTHGGE